VSKRQHQRQIERGRAKRQADRLAKRRRRARITAIAAVVALGLSVFAVALIASLDDGQPTVDDAPDDAIDETAAGEPCPPAEDVPEPAERQYDDPPEEVIDEDATYVATLDTTCGQIVLELDPQGAPVATNNFVFLAEDGYYDGVPFHRVVPDFVIQGGDPTGTGGGGPGYQFEDELETAEETYEQVRAGLLGQLEAEGEDVDEEMVPGGYPRGVLAMANAGPDTNGSQFFITLGEPTGLEPAYTIFGEVIEGMDVAERISAGPAEQQMAQEPVIIRSVEISAG
jgi:peptidyl-prolyl cis-trans isomerase B (cyclophilin B)